MKISRSPGEFYFLMQPLYFKCYFPLERLEDIDMGADIETASLCFPHAAFSPKGDVWEQAKIYKIVPKYRYIEIYKRKHSNHSAIQLTVY